MIEPTSSLSCLTEAVIKDISSKKLNIPLDEFKIIETQIKNASNEGENYVSHLLRLTVNLEMLRGPDKNQCLSFIIKRIDRDSRFGKFVDLDEVFEKEIFMYQTILPSLEKIWKDVGEEVVFSPRCFLTLNKSDKVIVLEDLVEAKYQMQPKELGLDLEDIKVVLTQLAKFHIASVVYLKEARETLPEIFHFGLFDDRYNSDWRHKQYDTLYSSMAEVVSTVPELEIEAEKIRSWKRNILGHVSKALQYDKEGFFVINHGDLWQNNVMFQKLATTGAILFDFQFSCIKSPAQDLFYFLSYALREDDRPVHYLNMLNFYYNELKTNAIKLNICNSIPTEEEFFSDLNRRGFAASFCMVFHLMNLLQEHDTKINMALALQQSDEAHNYRLKLYQSRNYLNAVTQFIKFLYEQHWLDVDCS